MTVMRQLTLSRCRERVSCIEEANQERNLDKIFSQRHKDTKEERGVNSGIGIIIFFMFFVTWCLGVKSGKHLNESMRWPHE
jgi:hypothetical protein